jgi:serine/threonine protein kinase
MAYSLELGGSIAVVQRKPATKELFIVRSFSGPNTSEKLSFLRQLQHDNVLLSHQIFSFKDVFYIVSEYMAISLEELTIARPDKPQLATIIHQVSHSYLGRLLRLLLIQILEDISFFISHNITHGAITCSNILLSSKGEVKIGI